MQRHCKNDYAMKCVKIKTTRIITDAIFSARPYYISMYIERPYVR